MKKIVELLKEFKNWWTRPRYIIKEEFKISNLNFLQTYIFLLWFAMSSMAFILYLLETLF